MNNLNAVTEYLYKTLVTPRSVNEHVARKEYLFNVLALTFLGLNTLAWSVSFYKYFVRDDFSENGAVLFLIVPTLILVLLYAIARRRFSYKLAYIFVGMYIVLATVGLNMYGLSLSHGLLVYALLIVISAIIISSKAALRIALLILAIIAILTFIQINSRTKEYVNNYVPEFSLPDSLAYLLILGAVLLVSLMCGREIERSLERMKKSETDLIKERESLESKIKAREKILEIEQMKINKEMYRFAEVGKLSSAILHDIADPLTAVSLNFELIESRQNSESIKYIREGITFLEQYLQSARRQIRRQGEINLFDSAEKISRVTKFLTTHARSNKVEIKLELVHGAKIYGDISKFSQIISNLISNAIDAYAGVEGLNSKIITVSSELNESDKNLVISVSDNGCGINKDCLEKIFDPFFSTKSSNGRGIGIGLSITKQIIEDDFKGKINVISTKGQGTRFDVILSLSSDFEENNSVSIK